MDIILIPMINNQEVYSGDQLQGTPYDEAEFKQISHQDQINVSPVNFFLPDTKKFPHFSQAIKEQISLAKGDCLFIPAFYFYHLQGYNLHSNSSYADQFDGPHGHQDHK